MPERAIFQPDQPHPWIRRLYALMLYFIVPLVPLYLWWRARKQPEYAQHWGERFGCYGSFKTPPQAMRIWLHAVSVGETRATQSLVEAVLNRYPDSHIILTCHTPTGRAAGRELFAPFIAQGRMTQLYVPYDLNPLLARFLDRFQPTAVWVMETEVWPNMIAQCVRRGIPISLINGRLSEKSLRQSQKWPRLMRNAYAGFTHVCAQTASDAQRYRMLGVTDAQLHVTGNLKFDLRMDTELIEQGARIKQQLGLRPIVALASSREGEEALWLDAVTTFETQHPAALGEVQWWIIPRHPQRFDEVNQLLQNSGKQVLRFSQYVQLSPAEQSVALQKADIVLGDTMGQMMMYYALTDVVLMGGTWLAHGGQNFLEPMALGKRVIVGKSLYNFEQIAQDALEKGVLWQMNDLSEAFVLLCGWLMTEDAQRDLVAKAAIKNFIEHELGVAHRIMNIVCNDETQQARTE